MALTLKVEFPRQNMTKLLRFIDSEPVRFAEAQALNRTAGNLSTVALSEVSKEMGISKEKLTKRGRRTDFRGSSKYGRVTKGRKANRRYLFTSIQSAGRPFNVKRFGGKPIYAGARTTLESGRVSNLRRRGKKRQRVVAVQHEAWGDPRVITGAWQLQNGAFVIPSGNSFRSVFGPGVTHVIEYPHIAGRLEREAKVRFVEHFSSAIEYAFGPNYHGR